MSNELSATLLGVLIILAAAVVVLIVASQNRRRFKTVFTPMPPVKKRHIPVTHALRLGVSSGGSSVNVMSADAPLGKIVLGGWNMNAWKFDEGDYLELFTGHLSTRYVIDDIARHLPSGWFSVKCTFAPRGTSAADGS